MKCNLKIMKFENKICGCRLTISALYFRNFGTARSEENKNQHNIEPCNSKTVGPANRSFPENTKRIGTKQQHQQITNNDKQRTKGNGVKLQHKPADGGKCWDWSQIMQLYIIFYSILGWLMSPVLHLSSWFQKARHISHFRLAAIMLMQCFGNT